MFLRAFLFLAISLSLPQFSLASNSCSALFQSPVLESISKSTFDETLKVSILSTALSNTKIKITSDREYIQKVLSKWDLKKSTPWEMERIAQAMVLKLDQKRTFAKWLMDLFVKKDAVKEAARVRAETLVLTEELINGLEVRGYLKSNSKFQNYKALRQKHYNKIQLAKFVAINAALIHFLGFPLYFPNIDLIKNLDLDSKDIEMVRAKGFERSYPSILERYKAKLKGQLSLEHAPHVFILSVAGYVGYNYLTFKVDQKIEETRYEVTKDVSLPVTDKFFNEWKIDFESREGREFDMRNPQDKRDWDVFIQSLYRAWADMFNEREGRYPDLSKSVERQEWEKFLSSLE